MAYKRSEASKAPCGQKGHKLFCGAGDDPSHTNGHLSKVCLNWPGISATYILEACRPLTGRDEREIAAAMYEEILDGIKRAASVLVYGRTPDEAESETEEEK